MDTFLSGLLLASQTPCFVIIESLFHAYILYKQTSTKFFINKNRSFRNQLAADIWIHTKPVGFLISAISAWQSDGHEGFTGEKMQACHLY